MSCFAAGDHLGRFDIAATVCVITPKAIVEDILEPELLLGDEPGVLSGVRQYNINDAADASGRRDLDS